jgi:rhodanese-related sulfurtransferase
MQDSVATEPYDRLSVERARGLFEGQATLWIDVREAGEWQQGRIPGALHIPLNQLLTAPRRHLTRDNIVFYCAQGIRSLVACEVAAAIGLTKVYNLEGGIREWAGSGLPIEAE